MGDAAQRRTGLDPLPGRVPPLPGGASRSAAAGAEPAAAHTAKARAETRSPRPAYRAIESQVDSEIRRYVETTAFTIRLRTEGPFDRSSLMRGILRAVLRSGLDLSDCDSEEEVTAALARYLPPGGG
jgi:hypothetical protein